MVQKLYLTLMGLLDGSKIVPNPNDVINPKDIYLKYHVIFVKLLLRILFSISKVSLLLKMFL